MGVRGTGSAVAVQEQGVTVTGNGLKRNIEI